MTIELKYAFTLFNIFFGLWTFMGIIIILLSICHEWTKNKFNNFTGYQVPFVIIVGGPAFWILFFCFGIFNIVVEAGHYFVRFWNWLGKN